MQYQLLPALSEEEYQNLKADIAERGVMVPIEIDEDGNILDGYHRIKICDELGLNYPVIKRQGWTEEQKIQHALSLNLNRRHLSDDQMAALVSDLRMKGYSIRKIAKMTDIPQTSVYRKLTGVPDGTPDRIEGADGKTYPAQQRKPEPIPVLFGDDDKSIKAAAREINREQIANPVLYKSESNEWYTPKEIIDRVLLLFGEIDLDPCSNDKENPNIPALNHYTQQDNGLSYSWSGKIYMNPPYGREISDWVNYLIKEYKLGNTKEAIALVPSRTDTMWFRKLREYPRCFIWGRLSFSDNDNAAPFPSMAVYLGQRINEFKNIFMDIGDVYRLL